MLGIWKEEDQRVYLWLHGGSRAITALVCSPFLACSLVSRTLWSYWEWSTKQCRWHRTMTLFPKPLKKTTKECCRLSRFQRRLKQLILEDLKKIEGRFSIKPENSKVSVKYKIMKLWPLCRWRSEPHVWDVKDKILWWSCVKNMVLEYILKYFSSIKSKCLEISKTW